MKKTLLFLVLANLSFTKLFSSVIYDPYYAIFISSGSAVCENLSLEFAFPDSLKTGFSSSVSIEKDLANNELNIAYTFTQNASAVSQSSILSNLNEYFLPLEPFINSKSYWNANISVTVDGNKKEFSKTLIPYGNCYQITNTCDEVRYVEKKIRYATDCGSTSLGYELKTRINEDSLIIVKEDMSVLTVCVAKEFGLDSVVVTFKELEDLNYSLYKKEEYLWIIYTTNTTNSGGTIIQDTIIEVTEGLPISDDIEVNFSTSEVILLDTLGSIIRGPLQTDTVTNLLGNVDLSNCLVNGLGSESNKKLYIYPNPTSENFEIDGFSGEISLTSQLGTRHQVTGNHFFDISNLPKGVYVVTFEKGGALHQEKILIK